MAIVDETPTQQYLYPEFVLLKRHMEAKGLTTVITGPEALLHRDGALWHADRRIDFVYNRLTDFYLASGNCAAVARGLSRG